MVAWYIHRQLSKKNLSFCFGVFSNKYGNIYLNVKRSYQSWLRKCQFSVLCEGQDDVMVYLCGGLTLLAMKHPPTTQSLSFASRVRERMGITRARKSLQIRMKAVEEIKGEVKKLKNPPEPIKKTPNQLQTNKRTQPSDAKVNVCHHSQRQSEQRTLPWNNYPQFYIAEHDDLWLGISLCVSSSLSSTLSLPTVGAK